MTAVTLPWIVSPITATLPPDMADQVEKVTCVLIDLPADARWAVFVSLLTPGSDDAVFVESSVELFTAILEQFGDVEIRTIAAAMAYRVSAHLDWRNAAARWLALSGVDPIEFMEANPAAGAFVLQAMSWPRSAISGDV